MEPGKTTKWLTHWERKECVLCEVWLLIDKTFLWKHTQKRWVIEDSVCVRGPKWIEEGDELCRVHAHVCYTVCTPSSTSVIDGVQVCSSAACCSTDSWELHAPVTHTLYTLKLHFCFRSFFYYYLCYSLHLLVAGDNLGVKTANIAESKHVFGFPQESHTYCRGREKGRRKGERGGIDPYQVSWVSSLFMLKCPLSTPLHTLSRTLKRKFLYL